MMMWYKDRIIAFGACLFMFSDGSRVSLVNVNLSWAERTEIDSGLLAPHCIDDLPPWVFSHFCKTVIG